MRPTDGNGSLRTSPERAMQPAWEAFIRYCRDLKYGEVERLSIQDGVPVSAEAARKKVKFTS